MTKTEAMSVIESNGAETESYGGLCTTCESASTCTYPRHPGNPVLQCEDWNGHFPIESPSVSQLEALYKKVNGVTPATREYGGLCTSCERREICTYTRPEGGVWHCAEFE